MNAEKTSVYCMHRLTKVEEKALDRVREELWYTCGSPLFPEGEHKDSIIVRQGISCASPMETQILC